MGMWVTFDSNVWRPVVSPDKFPGDVAIEAFRTIHSALKKGKVAGCLSETVFTLEAIKKVDRRTFFGAYSGNIESRIEEAPDGRVRLCFSFGPNPTAHPGNNEYLSLHLSDALKLGFKLMHCTRIAHVTNPDLQPEWFAEPPQGMHELVERFGAVSRAIEARGAGMDVLKRIGSTHAAGAGWLKGIKQAPESEDAAIAKAVAEWADADAVAAHVGYKNRFFCTRDEGKSAGEKSVLASDNRAWLEEVYGLSFITPERLALEIANEFWAAPGTC